jgi:N-acetylmuramoyl-L-alanine amidase
VSVLRNRAQARGPGVRVRPGAAVRVGWAAALAGTLALAAAACGTGGPAQPGRSPAPATGTASATPAPGPTGTPSPTTAPPSPTTVPGRTPGPTGGPTTPAAAALHPGATGAAVSALQQRLVALGYWLGTPDGRYGPSTEHAVTALQKVAGLRRDGVAGPATLRALDRSVRPQPRSRSGRVVEVDLARQVLLVVVDGRVAWTLDTSTGAVAGTTPVGQFRVFRQVDGYDRGPLGVLYRPKYFVGGVAVHGYPSVPPYPASHGCVRVTNPAMDWLWSTGTLPIGATVQVY